MGNFPHEREATTKTTLLNKSDFAICHACFCSGHIASNCPNTLKKTKIKDFNVKSDNIKNEFSTFIASSSKESSNYNFENNFDNIKHEFEFDEKSIDSFKNYFLKKEKSKLFIKVKNFEKNLISLKKENIELSLKNENLEKENSNLSSKIKYFENNVDFLKREKSELSEKIENFEKDICHLNQKLSECKENFESQRDDFMEKLSISQCNFFDSDMIKNSLELKVKELTSELEKYKNVSTKFTNDDHKNFISFATTFNDCDIFADDFNFEFTDDELYDHEGNSELSYEEKFRDLLKYMVLKRKENSNFSYKINNLEKEIIYLKKCLGENEKKMEKQKFEFEYDFENLQNKCLSSEKNLELQRSEFLEKLQISQSKFLACDKIRKELEEKNRILSSELEKCKSISKQFTIGSQGLDKLLNIGKSSKDKSGLGFYKNANTPSTSQTTFVKASKKVETFNGSKEKLVFENSSSQNQRPSVHKINKDKWSSSRTSSKKFIPICHHCGIVGHVRPKCFKLLNDQSYVQLGAYNRFHVSNSSFQKPSPNVFEKEKAKFYKNHISHQKFVPKCHHCGEIGHIRPKCQKLLKEKASVENSIFKKFDKLALEISKLKNDTFWKPSLNLTNSGKFEKMVWVKKEALKGKDKVFDFSKIKILRRPDNPSKLN